MSTKKTVEEFLIEEIEKSGFPLEIEVTSLLYGSKNWLPNNQEYYLDHELNLGRTIDIVSYYIGKYDPNSKDYFETLKTEPFSVGTDMVIECKKSNTRAWVFFTIPEVYRPPFFAGQTLDSLEVLTNGKDSIVDEIEFAGRDMETESFLYYDSHKRIAVAYSEIRLSEEQKSNGRRDIFEAISQITKYISYDFGKIMEGVKTDVSSRLLCFYFPVIVFEGRMYECIVEKNVPKLHKRDHILLRTHYQPKYSDSALSFGIDIVQKDYFPKFMQIVENDIYLLEERISQKRVRLAEIAEGKLIEL